MRFSYYTVFWIISYCVASAGELLLVENGRTDYTITLAAQASPVDQFAARELQFFLEGMTGVRLSISSGMPGKRLLIGGGKVLDDREHVIETSEGDILLYGGGVHGGLFAVYELLENAFGCMFLTAYGDLHIPRVPRLSLPEGKRTTRYAFHARTLMNWFYKDKEAVSLAFYRNRQNLLLHSGNHPRYPGKEPGIICRQEVFLGEHSLSRLIPPGVDSLKRGHAYGFLNPLPELKDKKYFESNPEYFSMDEKGQRVPNRQLCFSNPDLCKELEKNAVQFFRSEQHRTGLRGVLQVSCNDIAYNMCLCEPCQALQKQYQAEGAPLFLSLIRLAEKYPEIPFRTLAYQRGQTQRPPINLPALPENLSLIFAPINGDFANPLNAGENNRRDLEDFLGWTKITQNILFWYYPNPYNRSREQFFLEPPTAILERVAADIKQMRDSQIEGTYFEHDSGGVHIGTNFSELQTYVMLKLFQNPDLELAPLIQRFLAIFYGEAAPAVQLYHDELSSGMRKFTANGGSWSYKTMDSPFLTEENLLRWDALLDAAEKSAGSEYAFRVRLLRLGLDSTIVSKVDMEHGLRLAKMREVLHELSQKRSVNLPMEQFEKWVSTLQSSPPPKPLPAEFTGFQQKDLLVYDVPEQCLNLVQMPEASSGRGIFEEWDGKTPFRLGTYDQARKVYGTGMKIDAAKIQGDGFAFYRFPGTVRLTPDMVLFGGAWRMFFRLGSKCSADDPSMLEKEWQVYISLKFESNRVITDRVVLTEISGGKR